MHVYARVTYKIIIVLICACAVTYELIPRYPCMQAKRNNETMRKQDEAPEMADGNVSGNQRGAGTLVLDRLRSIAVTSRHAQATTQLRLQQCQRQ